MKHLKALLPAIALILVIAGCEQSAETEKLTGSNSSASNESKDNGTAKTESGGWHTNLDEAKQLAKSQNKMLFVDFTASWCPPCQMYIEEVFPTNAFKKAAEDYILVKIDTDEQGELANKFGVSGIPDIRLMDPNGKEIAKVVGFKGADIIKDMEAAKKKAGL